MKRKKILSENAIAQLMMMCGALHDLAEMVPSKATHITTIQHKIEKIIAYSPSKVLKQTQVAKRA